MSADPPVLGALAILGEKVEVDMWILLFTVVTAAVICLSVAAIVMKSAVVGRLFTRQAPQVPISRERALLSH
jgi:hypothetical protein